jgi:hypothetical protein
MRIYLLLFCYVYNSAWVDWATTAKVSAAGGFRFRDDRSD